MTKVSKYVNKVTGLTISSKTLVTGFLVIDKYGNYYIVTYFDPEKIVCDQCGVQDMDAYEVCPESVSPVV